MHLEVQMAERPLPLLLPLRSHLLRHFRSLPLLFLVPLLTYSTPSSYAPICTPTSRS